MQEDFHYYATYCAAVLAGYSHEESLEICYSDQMTDICSETFLQKIGAPTYAASTQLQMEMMNKDMDILGLQDITRIWASFHFLPGDLEAEVKHSTRIYKNKYRLICNPNGKLLAETVRLAKDHGTQAAGIAMHVLADTWAHRYFAGTPSLVINNTDDNFYELIRRNGEEIWRKITFVHRPGVPDDIENGKYINTMYQPTENAIMNLGHGRAGHLPDLSYAVYRYMPEWNGCREVVKNNQEDYFSAFTQVIYALKYLRGACDEFELNTYDTESVRGIEQEIREILAKRQLNACEDWKKLGEKLSGCEIPAFDAEKYTGEYMNAGKDDKNDTFLGRYILGTLRQKSMVTNRIFSSGSMLAGYSVTLNRRGFRGIRDFKALAEEAGRTRKNERK